MRRWAWILGGLMVWAVHFIGVYLISSVADVVATADDPAWRGGALAFSAVCCLAVVLLLARALRKMAHSGGQPRFQDQLAALGAGVAIIAIIWQALPTIIGF